MCVYIYDVCIGLLAVYAVLDKSDMYMFNTPPPPFLYYVLCALLILYI